MSSGIFSFFIQLYHVEVNPLEPRRCRIRTAIHRPKRRVLPLHYILYMVPRVSADLTTPVLSGRCSTAELPRHSKTVFSIFYGALSTKLRPSYCEGRRDSNSCIRHPTHYHLKVAVTVFILYIYYIIFFYKNQILVLSILVQELLKFIGACMVRRHNINILAQDSKQS